LGIYPGHDVPDGSVLACSIHGLEYQQQRIPIGCIEKPLQRCHLFEMFTQAVPVFLLGIEKRFEFGGPFPKIDFFQRPDPELLGFDFHFSAFGYMSLWNLRFSKEDP